MRRVAYHDNRQRGSAVDMMLTGSSMIPKLFVPSPCVGDSVFVLGWLVGHGVGADVGGEEGLFIGIFVGAVVATGALVIVAGVGGFGAGDIVIGLFEGAVDGGAEGLLEGAAVGGEVGTMTVIAPA